MESQKKTWETPQLIILARGTPEESVLLQCKRIEIGAIGSDGPVQTSCNSLEGGKCANCAARGTS